MHLLKPGILAVVLWATAVQSQTTVDIPLQQASDVATRALLAGETALAVQIAEAVLLQKPDDRAALMVVAAGAPRLENPARGYEAGVRAWRLSTTGFERYEAARMTALAANTDERFTTASIWLRLALVDAPNDAEAERTRQDGRMVAQRNPWSTQLSFSLAPSSNVNGGAEDEVSSAPGNPDGLLSEDAQNLAGWRANLGLSTSYRLHQDSESRTIIGLSLRADRVWITEETDVPNEAFDTSSAEVFVRHERALGDGALGLSLSTGEFRYRSLDGLTNTTEQQTYTVARIGADYRFAVNPQTLLQISAGRDMLRYEAPGIGDVARARVGASVSHVLDGGDRINVSYSFTDSVGDSVNYTSTDHGLSAGYNWAEPVGDVSIAVGGGFRWADYPDYRLLNPVTGGRQDETVFANLSLGFANFEFAGFTPGIRIDASRTQSNVSRFNSESLGASLTIRSSF